MTKKKEQKQAEITETKETVKDLEEGLNEMVTPTAAEEVVENTEQLIKESLPEVPEPPKLVSPTISTLPSTPNPTSKPSKASPFREPPDFLGQTVEQAGLKVEGLQITYSDDKDGLERFKEFLDTQWGPPGVQLVFSGIFRDGYPPIPHPSLWDIPNIGIDVPKLVYQQIQNEDFIDEMWPSIVMMLGDNIRNQTWAAHILTVLGFFRMIQILPIILQEY